MFFGNIYHWKIYDHLVQDKCCIYCQTRYPMTMADLDFHVWKLVETRRRRRRSEKSHLRLVSLGSHFVQGWNWSGQSLCFPRIGFNIPHEKIRMTGNWHCENLWQLSTLALHIFASWSYLCTLCTKLIFDHIAYTSDFACSIIKTGQYFK